MGGMNDVRVEDGRDELGPVDRGPPGPARLRWVERTVRGRPVRDGGRFTVVWDTDPAGYTLYDRDARRHYRGFLNAPNAQAFAEALASGTATPKRVILVGCGARKLDRAAEARDLYTGPLFKKARRYAEEQRCPWFVLSAKHGLVEPGRVLHPYDLALSDLTDEQRAVWAAGVRFSLWSRNLLGGTVVEVHAGRGYVVPLRPLVDGVADPLRGLSVGRRLAWYDRQARERAESVGDAENGSGTIR